jgi:uncharacterized membrane protein
MEPLSKEQEKQIRKIKMRFMFRSFLTGINTALLAVAFNLIGVMAAHLFFEDSDTARMVIALATALFVVIRANNVIQDHAKDAVKDLTSVFKKEE